MERMWTYAIGVGWGEKEGYFANLFEEKGGYSDSDLEEWLGRRGWKSWEGFGESYFSGKFSVFINEESETYLIWLDTFESWNFVECANFPALVEILSRFTSIQVARAMENLGEKLEPIYEVAVQSDEWRARISREKRQRQKIAEDRKKAG
jgi:hypothetical protein